MTEERRAILRRAADAAARTSPTGDTLTPIIATPPETTRGLSAGRLHIPGGRTTTPQYHQASECIVVVLSGHAAVLSGPRMRPHLPLPGDMLYIPPAVGYSIINLSYNATVLALVFRTDPGFATDIHRLTHHDALVREQIDTLRADHLARLHRTHRSPPPRR